MTAVAKAEIAEAAAVELREIEHRLKELQADLSAAKLHRATLRVERMILLAHTTASGLRQQAGKIRGRLSQLLEA